MRGMSQFHCHFTTRPCSLNYRQRSLWSQSAESLCQIRLVHIHNKIYLKTRGQPKAVTSITASKINIHNTLLLLTQHTDVSKAFCFHLDLFHSLFKTLKTCEWPRLQQEVCSLINKSCTEKKQPYCTMRGTTKNRTRVIWGFRPPAFSQQLLFLMNYHNVYIYCRKKTGNKDS